MSTKEKNFWVLLVFLLAGLVIGGLLGTLAHGSSAFWWLAYGMDFGLTSPVVLNLKVISVTFGLSISINIASIIGMALAIFIYRKV